MKLTPIGVGDAFTALHYSFCLLVEHEGFRLLIDCPHPIRKMLREASAPDLDAIDAVVVTHTHADHCSGLEGLAFFNHFVLQRPTHLICHPDVGEGLWDHHLHAGMHQLIDAEHHKPTTYTEDDFFRRSSLGAEPLSVGPFQLEARKTIHHIPTTALRIRAGGRCLGISSDTAFDPTLITWLAESDLIVHETNYGAHTPYESLLSLPKTIQQKMRLVHYPDDFDLEASVIEPLRQGQAITI